MASPEDEVMRREEDRELLHALRGLKLRERQAIYLRYYDGQSFSEIAVLLAIKESAARVIVHRALQRLRERLSPGDAVEEVLT